VPTVHGSHLNEFVYGIVVYLQVHTLHMVVQSLAGDRAMVQHLQVN